jgi:hypothetical protein
MAAAPSAPSEMLSGPDLGGGYLHQLSIDRLEGTTTFTHHAQEGGSDAGGPPVGALDRLGFVHPPTPCMFGGPRCWHRRYLLPFSATPRVRFAYQRLRFVLETMLRQAWDLEPVPFGAALGELVAKVAGPLADAGVEWYVAGSGAVALAGGGGTPHDIDLGVPRDGVDRLGELLREYLIEPVAPTDGSSGRLVLGGRAFVGTPKVGARVEWAVPLEPGPPLPAEEFAATAGVTRTIPVPFAAGPLRVSRPEYALVRAASRRRADGVDAAVRAIAHVGPDAELLDVLLARSAIPAEERTALRSRALGAA